MPVFEFTVSKDVKVVAPDRLVAARALSYRYRTDTEEEVDLGALGRATITDDDEPRITAKRERKARKEPKESSARIKDAMDNLAKGKHPAFAEVKDACYICGKDLLPDQPLREIKKGEATYIVHAVCAGGAT